VGLVNFVGVIGGILAAFLGAVAVVLLERGLRYAIHGGVVGEPGS
jgi:hypothetical protein